MKLRRFGPGEGLLHELQRDLRLLVDQPTARECRPCAGCEEPCGCPKRSIECCCGCSPDCPTAHRYLSSEPESHPIESGIVPLVYALSELRVVPPCWSCEGHISPDRRWMRPPQVWFYSRSATYPQLIASYLAGLQQHGTISKAWEAVVSPHTEDGVAIFILRASIEDKVNPRLMRELQEDVGRIAQSLAEEVREAAMGKLEKDSRQALE